MCGRFALYSSFSAIKDYADLLNEIDGLNANYNVAPGTEIPIIQRQNNQNILSFFRWGLIPFWAKDEKIAYKLINARSETIGDKPSFKYAFQKRRCLIPANGFYEWRKSDKQPFYIKFKDRELITFAGIWEIWRSPSGKHIHSCSIITTSPNELMKNIHNRMPVILTKDQENIWLESSSKDDLINLLNPYPENEMTCFPITSDVNSVKNNYPELIKAV